MNKVYEINLGEILKSIWRFKWVIIIITILSGVAMFVFAKQKSVTQYQAAIDVAVVAKDGTGEENPIQYVYVADLALIDYKKLVTSNAFAEKVSGNNQETLSKDDVLNAIKIEVSPSSRIMTIKITANSKENVAKIKDYLTSYAKSEIESITAIKEIKLLNEGVIKEIKSNKNTKLTVMGVAIGLFGSIVCVLVYVLFLQLFKK